MSELLTAAVILGATALVAAAIYVVVTRLVSGLKLNEAARSSIALIVKGPVLTAVVVYGLYSAVSYVYTQNPSSVPYFAHPDNLVVLLQLVVLAVSVRTAGSVIRRVMPSLTGARGADRVLVYGIYSLGLIALSYVVLSSPLTPEVTGNVWSAINFLSGLFATYLVVYVVNIVIKRYAIAIEGKEKQLQTTITFVRRLVLAGIVLVGVAATTFTSFPAAGGVIASLFIAAGFASIVVGLAAQTSLSNLIAGLVISTSQPFQIGEAILFSNEWCWVDDIRLTFTVLRTWDNRKLMVPNQLFLNNTIVNYDAGDSSKLCIVFVTITYESDLDEAIRALKEVAKAHPDFRPAGDLPVVHVMDFTESGVSLRLLSRAKDQPTNFQMSKDILYGVKKEFDARGIKLAYPRRRLELDGELREAARRALDGKATEDANPRKRGETDEQAH